MSKCLIIGVRKCGTRALLEMLNLHPRIQKAAGEVHFFDRDENYIKGLEWYRKKMPHSFRGQITIGKSTKFTTYWDSFELMNVEILFLLITEKSPSYFVTPEVSLNLTFKIGLRRFFDISLFRKKIPWKFHQRQ